jgi:hypothetical protein
MMFITFYFELHKALGCYEDSFVFLLFLKLSIFHFVDMAHISFTTFIKLLTSALHYCFLIIESQWPQLILI